MKTELERCACGAMPERQRISNGKRTRFRVYCARCKRQTHWHRPMGGDLTEWREVCNR